MQYFNVCELHEIVSQTQYPELWSWQVCENFTIHSFIHALTHSLTHSPDWKGFYNFCYFIFFFPNKL